MPSPSQPRPHVSDLTESVASVAETFFHQELSPGEEASLRKSFHSDLADSAELVREHVPGGLNPFLLGEEETPGDVDPDGISIFASLIESLLARFAFEARDIQITLVNPGQTSYTLTIPEIRYATETKNTAEEAMHPGNGQSVPSKRDISGVTRSIIISGLNVTCRDIRLRTSSPISPTSSFGRSSASTLPELPLTRRGIQQQEVSRSTSSLSSSSSHSDSDIDEETQMLMSQSVAFLPPRSDKHSPSSLSTSVSSSMYHSTVSTVEPTVTSARGSAMEIPQTSTPVDYKPSSFAQVMETEEQQSTCTSDLSEHLLEGESFPLLDDLILSFGSEPIAIRLTTPPPISKAPGPFSAPDVKKEKTDPENRQNMDAFKLSITVGVMGFALRAWHLRGLLDIIQAWDIRSRPPTNNTPTGLLVPYRLNATVHIKGVVMLLLPSALYQRVGAPRREPELARFFEYPLTPPQISHGYVRVHVDGCHVSVNIPQYFSTSVRRQSSGVPSQTSAETLNVSLSIIDVSAFAFSTGDSSSIREYYASPILITDSNLPLQYPLHMQPYERDSSIQSLSFSIIDWTNPSHRTSAAKSSQWRTKVPQQRSHKQTSSSDRPVYVHASGLSPPSNLGREVAQAVSRSHLPAVTASMTMISASQSATAKVVANSLARVEVSMVPFHVFVDLGSLSRDANMLAFINELMIPSVSSSRDLSQSQSEHSDEESHGDDDSTPPATPFTSHPAGIHEQQWEREWERRRLEKLVLEDLDLALDYRPEPSGRNSPKVASWRKVPFSIDLIQSIIAKTLSRTRPPVKKKTSFNCR
jgi:autophagy-related protein 2